MNQDFENINNELLTAYLSNELGTEQIQLIEAWINASEENQKEFDAFRKIWAYTDAQGPLPVEVDTESALQKLMSRIEVSEIKRDGIPKTKPNWLLVPLKIAAVLTTLFIFGYLLFFRSAPEDLLILQAQDQNRQYILPDNTSIHLKAGSAIHYPSAFTDTERRVTLEGEAFFDVTSSPTAPFIINVSGLQVVVHGTSFNVNDLSGNDTVYVSVVDGSVSLYSYLNNGLSDSLLLEKGQEGCFSKSDGRLFIKKHFDSNLLFWTTQSLTFNKTPLRKVFSIIEDAYNVNIEADESALGELRLTSSFESETADRVMEIIAESFKLGLERRDSTFIVRIQKDSFE